MVKKWREGLAPLRDALLTVWWVILVVGLGFVAAFQFVEPAPPKRIVITTGGESGAYFAMAQRYKTLLAQDGIEVEVRSSAGSLENLGRLQRNEAQVAFVQGGVRPSTVNPSAEPEMRSLGSVYYEPVWVFYRASLGVRRLADLRGRRLAVGGEGSGVRQLALQLLAANGRAEEVCLSPLSGLPAAEALLAGEVDAVMMIAAEHTAPVQRLLRAQEIRLLSFDQAAAYQKRFPFLSRLTFPQGAVDLLRDWPPQDVTLLSPTANLVVRADLHPALQTLLLQAAQELHAPAGFFQTRGEFPSYRDPGFPLSAEAERFFKSGPPFLQRYLPFWLAVLIDRLVVLLVPIFALLIPLLKVAPALYNWRIRSKVFRCYGELKYLEDEIRTSYAPAQAAEYRSRLERIEEEAQGLHLPLGFTDLVYTLREHVNFVRQALDKREVLQ